MKRITIFALENIGNGGDEMLGDTTIYHLNKIGNYSIKRKQLIPLYKELGLAYIVDWGIGSGLIRLSYKLGGENIAHRLFDIGYKISNFRYLWKATKDTDCIIYAVGMLKYSTQDFSHVFDLINRIATYRHIPVLMSAMSIEKPNEKDWRFKQLVRAVNRECVKIITTRDGIGGLERLRKYYIKRPNIVSDYVGDPALWASECYEIKKKENNGKKILGIGLIRTDIYEDYEGGLTKSQLKDFYRRVVAHFLRSEKTLFKLFCNGTDSDYAFGKELIEEFNLPQDQLLPKPKTARELVHLISGFDVVFGARLHACITSVSLGIPVSGLLWDNKLDFFSKSVGIREYFSSTEDVKDLKALSNIENSFAYKYDHKAILQLKNKTHKYILEFIQQWI